MAVLGGSLSVLFFAYSGILFMTAEGDPTKSAKARSSFIGVIVGVSIVGLSFLIPGVISQVIIVPAGGVGLQPGVAPNDCDGLLRRQLVIQRAAHTPTRMNHLIQGVQGRHEACSPEIWAPWVDDENINEVKKAQDCGGAAGIGKLPIIGALPAPPGLVEFNGRVSLGILRVPSMRDGVNNILVYWKSEAERPWDNSVCWVYFGRFDTWRASY